MSKRVHEAYERIATHRDNPVFIHVVPKDEALAQVEAARGPLAGRLFAVKDNIDVAGLPTTAACPAFSYVAQKNAAAVLCEHYAVQGRPDISAYGGWRAYCASLRNGAVRAP